MTAPVLLIHGGLWDTMDADGFWRTPGIVAGLESAGLTVLAPDRPRNPDTWSVEVAELSKSLGSVDAGGLESSVAGRFSVVGASNGCSAAVLLALAYPQVVERLLLAWPATGGDPAGNERARAWLLSRGASAEVADGLLTGKTLRGVTDAEVAALTMPVGVLPSIPENPSHQRKTVDALLGLISGSVELAGSQEPPVPGFSLYLDRVVAEMARFLD